MRSVVLRVGLLVLLTALVAAAPATPTGTIAGRVTLTKNGKPQSCEGTIVYLADEPGLAASTRAPAVIRQKNRQFIPGLTVVVKGTRVDFPNDDKVGHKVHSDSRTASDLNFDEYGVTETPSYTFRVAGQVDLGCKIHPEMHAKVFVVPNRYYAKVGDACTFKIDGVPAGPHELVAWSGNKDILSRRRIVVEAGKTTEAVSLSIRKTGP
jgi:plastocyanin